MSNSEVKKRNMLGDKSKTMEPSTDPHEAKSRTVSWDDIPQWQRDNKYLIRGYRLGPSNLKDILISLTFLHNETCNVYTHVIGALILPLAATAFMRVVSDPRFFGVSELDYAMFGIYFTLAEFCLIVSTTYHLIMSQSADAEQFWLRMDLLGIVIHTVGTFVSGICYIFFCEPSLQKVHWAIIIASGFVTATSLMVPRFRRWRTARTVAYIALGASSLIPLLHGTKRYGLEYMLQYSGMYYYLIELSFYLSGALLYAFRTPERLSPGTFDIFGASHQIFHVFILCAIYSHVTALNQAFTACHTLDICKIQDDHRAS